MSTHTAPEGAYTEQRTEYVVCIPDVHARLGRREVRRYAERDDDGEGATLSVEHVAHLHRLGERDSNAARREAFAVKQIITVAETRL